MRAIGLAMVLVFLVACGSSSNGDAILQLGSGDVTEADFRVRVRELFLDVNAREGICPVIDGLSPEDAEEVLRDRDTPPVQESDPDARVRASEIVQEECKRIN